MRLFGPRLPPKFAWQTALLMILGHPILQGNPKNSGSSRTHNHYGRLRVKTSRTLFFRVWKDHVPTKIKSGFKSLGNRATTNLEAANANVTLI